MNIHPGHIEVKFTEEGCAKVVFDVFFYEYSMALSEEMSVRHELQAAKSAKQAYEEEWRQKDGLGWCSGSPYTDQTIKQMENNAKQAEHRLKEATAVMNFVRDVFLKEYSLKMRGK